MKHYREELKLYKIIETDIVNTKTGLVLGSTTPKFADWGEEDYETAVVSKVLIPIEPMTATELEVNDYSDKIAEEKFDGHRCVLNFTPQGARAFSRRISKKTGYYNENTDQLPHIRDIITEVNIEGTILDGEIVLPIEGCNCRKVQSVLGAKPAKAIDFQINNGFAVLNAFDIIYYKGSPVHSLPLHKRKEILIKAVKEIHSPFIKLAPMYCTEQALKSISSVSTMLPKYLNLVDSYSELYSSFTRRGKEGIMLKGINNIYEFKRTKYFIKMKPHLTFDVVILGYEPPDKIYEGKTLREKGYWSYWEDTDTKEVIFRDITLKEADIKGLVPVTKYYANNWIGAIKFGVWKDGELIEVGHTSGFDEKVRKEVSENADKHIGDVIEVEAQCIINKETGSLQHPRFICFRHDKSSEMCTFEAHIREV